MIKEPIKGMGEAVAKRTVFRGNETWGDVAKRVSHGNCSLYSTGSHDISLMENRIGEGSLLMSGRHLQHGDSTQSKRNLEIYTNCFDGSVKVITIEHGPIEFSKIVGREVTVKSGDGQWRPAICHNYGLQKIYKVVFANRNNGKSNYEISTLVTSNHRWILEDETETTELKVGDILAIPPSLETDEGDLEALRHGLIFGDGSSNKNRNDYGKEYAFQGHEYASIRLCGKDKKYLRYFNEDKFTITYPNHAKGDPCVYVGKKQFWKDLPFTTDPQYINSFIYGWWLADGSKTYKRSGGMEISTCNELAVNWLYEYAAMAGYKITGVTKRERKDDDGSFKNGKTLWSVRFSKYACSRVHSIEYVGEREVFCFEEPVTKSFVLANGLLTGNCATSSSSFMLFNLLMNGAGVGRSYDDDMMLVNWDYMPKIRAVLSHMHQDYNDRYDSSEVVITGTQSHLKPSEYVIHEVGDSREGWSKVIEILETASWKRTEKDKIYIFDFSKVRPEGSPIGGMQNRPSSGPVALMKSLYDIFRQVRGRNMPLWKQAIFVDHFLARTVIVGGARRAARMATKFWKDEGAFEFCTLKEDNPETLWSANYSLTVDKEFWDQAHIEGTLANKLFLHATNAAYGNRTGEPGFINYDRLSVNLENISAEIINHDRYPITEDGINLYATLHKRMMNTQVKYITNPCGEIPLSVEGGYCVLADMAPYNLSSNDDFPELARLATRSLIRTNLMPSIYQNEVKRTNRIGVGLTGLFEYAWKFWNLSFKDLLNEQKSIDFWNYIKFIAEIIDEEAASYSKELGVNTPHTTRTVKPAGSTSKLYHLTEGIHLPPMKQYIRWVQFKNSDPLVRKYELLGYPVKKNLKSYTGMSIVGFPHLPEITKSGAEFTLASEATMEEQFKWLQLIEKYWLFGDKGNQASYTLKYNPNDIALEEFRQLVLTYQPTIKCCSVMPMVDTTIYEYQPEQPISDEEFDRIVANIKEEDQIISMDELQCQAGVCPI